MAKNLDGVIVRIEARHDFNTVVAERVFVPGDPVAIHTWVTYITEVKMDQARRADPTFDEYHFASEESPIIVQISE